MPAFLEAKLRAPRSRRGVVARPRITDRLARGAESRLTLVSAPPGFGKTTLLADWLATRPADAPPVAWLSLDPADDEPASFWRYLIAAVRTVVPDAGEDALRLLDSPDGPISAVLGSLLNEFGATSNDIVLVLDDHHAIGSPDVAEGMAFLVEHLPARMHLVIATRADPALPLARFRARGELVEIRAAELRFTTDEAAAYLTGVMGLALTDSDIAALESRTEGWIAALQLAALSMEGRDDVAGFIAGFAGDDRYIVDYLVEEVLKRQTDDVRAFLLATSILDRLSGSLCDAVTGQRAGKATLDELDRRNVFMVPLDDQRRWYRYHHLFADVLHARLLDEQPEDVAGLHRRACAWFEANGDRPEAIDHALAGGDVDRAADLIELANPAMRQARQEATLRRWLEAIPEDTYDVRPVLAIASVGSRLVSAELAGVDSRMRQAERWLDPDSMDPDGTARRAAGMVVVDEDGFRRLPVVVAIYRTALARGAGDEAGTIASARHVLDVIGADDHLERGAATGFLGLASWSLGDLDAAHAWWSASAASLEKAGHLSDVLGVSIALADIRIAQGRLSEARRTYEHGIEVAERMDPPRRGLADMHVGLAALCRERDDLAGAAQHLRASEDLGDRAGLAQNAYRWKVAMARIREAEGDLDDAVTLLDEAGRLYASDYFPYIRPIPAMKARIRIAQGRLADVAGWAREGGLAVDDDLSYLREFDHITLARWLLARPRSDAVGDDARRLLERLLADADAGGRTSSSIEILVLLARARDSVGDRPGALGSLERALTLAEPEGYARVFIDEGRPMMALLDAAARHGIARDYVGRLVTPSAGAAARPPGPGGLVEPVSERELDVLRLLATDLDGPDIARELVVSLHTVRSHTKSIYAKLGVNNRRAAVRRAQELGLVAR